MAERKGAAYRIHPGANRPAQDPNAHAQPTQGGYNPLGTDWSHPIHDPASYSPSPWRGQSTPTSTHYLQSPYESPWGQSQRAAYQDRLHGMDLPGIREAKRRVSEKS